MTRRGGFIVLGVSLAIFALCAGLVAWRLLPRKSAPPAVSPSGVVSGEAPEVKVVLPGKLSTIIDLPGDPVLIRRGATQAPRMERVALPIKLAANAPKIESQAFFISTTLVSTDGGFMGKFPEAGQEADAIAAQIAMADAQNAAAGGAELDAGSDDDGGAATPESIMDLAFTPANSSQLDVFAGGANGQPQIKQAIIKTVVPEKIGDLLIVNGFSEESARLVEAAAKALYNVQTLPPQSFGIALGALDTSGAYRVTQISIYENNEYVGAVALAESGFYGESAQPAVPSGVLDDSGKAADATVHYNVADGVYSAGLRNNMPEPVIREAIQLLGRLTDLKGPLQADENIRALYARDFRGKSKSAGKVIYVGLTGAAGAIDCYVFESADGAFRCFDPKGGVTPPWLSGGLGGGGGATSVGGVLTPIKGAPVTSLFGMRFHPILHILRLHAGIDFGAPVGSPVRAVADGKVEFTGPKAGFGNQVKIQHKGFETSVNHLSEIPDTIKPGVVVTQGQIIALSGNTGLSTGPHLHFEFYLDGSAVDPMPHLGTEVAGPAGSATPSVAIAPAVSEQEIAAFDGARKLVDAALEAATH